MFTRCSQDLSQGIEDFCQQQQFQTLLMLSQIDQQMKKNLEIAFNANTAISNATDNAINAIDDVVDELANVDIDEDIVNMENYMEGHKKFQFLSKNFNAPEQSFSSAKINSKIQNSLDDLLQDAYQEDEVMNNLIVAKQRGQ